MLYEFVQCEMYENVWLMLSSKHEDPPLNITTIRS